MFISMPVERAGEKYYTSAEAARYIGVSRPTFNNNIRPQLSGYKIGGFKRTYYREMDLEPFKVTRPADTKDEEH